MDVKLVIYSEDKQYFSREVSLPCTIGRAKQCDVTIIHPLVSRRHCEIYEETGRVMVRDVGSLNGTYYLGMRLGRGAHIPYGASFSIGRLNFQIEPAESNDAPDVFLQDSEPEIPGASAPREDLDDDVPPSPEGPAQYRNPMEREPQDDCQSDVEQDEPVPFPPSPASAAPNVDLDDLFGTRDDALRNAPANDREIQMDDLPQAEDDASVESDILLSSSPSAPVAARPDLNDQDEPNELVLLDDDVEIVESAREQSQNSNAQNPGANLVGDPESYGRTQPPQELELIDSLEADADGVIDLGAILGRPDQN